MAADRIVWKGTQEEALSLQAALEHNCMCVYDQETGARTTTCEPHRMLAEEQRTIDHLVFARRIAARFLKEEFNQK